MKKKMGHDNRGLTIVDVAASMFLSSILVLTVGSMLFFGFLSWRRNSEAVGMQRDATIAMELISRAVRPVRGSFIQASGSTLNVGDESFYVSGNSLWYDPDDSVSGNEIEVIKGTVDTNSVTFIDDTATRSVIVDLNLSTETRSVSLTSVIGHRV